MLKSFAKTLSEHKIVLDRRELTTLQINIGKLCNQTCFHCHVDAGPSKTRENMDEKTARRLVKLGGQSQSIKTVDLTGGAPELNQHFRYLVEEFSAQGKEIIDRCNLTVFFEAGQESTPAFLADHKVRIIASLPCYSKENVEKQRGEGVFGKSIEALKILNHLGYGTDGSGLHLDLVYNPVGPVLPPPQQKLQQEYKKRLREDFGIEFNQLITITNMPIKRFLFDLKKSNRLEEYMTLLINSFNPEAASGVMCRSFLSIGWDGALYDCDFNQMLSIPAAGKKQSIWDIDSFEVFSQGGIAVADHCYGCTAGAGSSCAGAIV